MPEGVVIGVEDSGHVFPEANSGRSPTKVALAVNFIEKVAKGEGEVSALVTQAAAQPGHAEGLAGRAAAQRIRLRQHLRAPLPPAREIAEIRHAGVVVGQQRAREGLDLGKRQRLPPERVKRDAGGLDAGADGEEAHDGGAVRSQK